MSCSGPAIPNGRSTPRKSPSAQQVILPDLLGRVVTAKRPNHLWLTDIERHEALLNLAVVKGHRLRLVAAGRLKLRAA